MQRTITVNLTQDIMERLDRAAREDGVTRNEVIRRSLRSYLFEREFHGLRWRLMIKAAARGLCTDKEVFERIS